MHTRSSGNNVDNGAARSNVTYESRSISWTVQRPFPGARWPLERFGDNGKNLGHPSGPAKTPQRTRWTVLTPARRVTPERESDFA